MTMTGRTRQVAAAVLVAVALLAGAGSLQGATASTLSTGSATDATVAAVQRILASPSYAVAERAVLAGQPVPAVAEQALEQQVAALAATPAYAAAVAELAPQVGSVAVDERGVPEFMYHLNQGNQRMLAAVGVFTVLVVPGIAACSIGSAASCVPFWVLLGASLAAGAVLSGALEYVQAVLSLP
jgi:hypothetical protein